MIASLRATATIAATQPATFGDGHAPCLRIPMMSAGLSPRAIDLLVERLGQTAQIGDDEAAIGALRSGLDAGDDAALDFPALGGVEEVAITADLISLTADPSHGGILGEIADPVQQHCVAGEAKDVADALALAPRHRLGPAVVAVAAHQNLDRRTAGADGGGH